MLNNQTKARWDAADVLNEDLDTMFDADKFHEKARACFINQALNEPKRASFRFWFAQSDHITVAASDWIHKQSERYQRIH